MDDACLREEEERGGIIKDPSALGTDWLLVGSVSFLGNSYTWIPRAAHSVATEETGHSEAKSEDALLWLGK